MVNSKLMVRMFALFHSPQFVATIEKGRFEPAFFMKTIARLSASEPDVRHDNRKSHGPPCAPASLLRHI